MSCTDVQQPRQCLASEEIPPTRRLLEQEANLEDGMGESLEDREKTDLEAGLEENPSPDLERNPGPGVERDPGT